MTSSRLKFVEAARSFLGVKWKHMGRSRNGLDCVGLLIESAKLSGIKAPESWPVYERTPTNADLLIPFDTYCRPKDLSQIVPGDIVVTRDDSTVLPCHCGIIAEAWGDLRMIHASIRRRKVVEEAFSDWRPFAIRAYEVREE